MRLLFGLLLTTLVMCNVAQADYALRWSPLTSTSSGSPISVDLFLDETAPDTNLANFGAVGASYKVDLSGVGALQIPIGNPGFDLINTLGSNATQSSLQQTSIFGLTSTGGSLKIGSFTIDPTFSGNGSLKAILFGSGADFGIYNSTLDPQIQDGVLFPAPEFNFSFSAVPEPGSVVTCTALGAFGVLRRRRRKKAGEADRWKRWRRRQRKTAKPDTGFATSKNWH